MHVHSICRAIAHEIPDRCTSSDVAKALHYTLNQWHKILVCFEAGTNNALIYTLLANCRTQGLDPEDYVVEVLKRLPHDASQEQAAALTPARLATERRAKAEATEVA